MSMEKLERTGLFTRRHMLLGLWTAGCVGMGGYGLLQFLKEKPVLYDSSPSWQLKWSPTGQQIARHYAIKKPIEIFDALTNKISAKIGSNNNFDFAWSPNGRFIAIAELNEAVSIWDTQTGLKTQTIAVVTDTFWPNSVAYSPDGRFLLVSSDLSPNSPPARQYEVASGKLIREYHINGTNKGLNNPVSWSPNGKYVAVHISAEVLREKHPTIYIYDASNGTLLDYYRGEIITDDTNQSQHQWSPDSQYLAIKNNFERHINVLKITEQKKLKLITKKEQIHKTSGSFAWKPHTHVIVSVEGWDELHFWNALTSTGIHQLPIPREMIITTITWSSDGTYLAIGLDDKNQGKTLIWHYK